MSKRKPKISRTLPCKFCQQPFTTDNPTRRYCGDLCYRSGQRAAKAAWSKIHDRAYKLTVRSRKRAAEDARWEQRLAGGSKENRID